MKSIIAFFFSIGFFVLGYSQDPILQQPKKDIVKAIITQDSINKAVILKETQRIENSWMENNWDNNIYNPYKNSKKSLPINIVFKDSTFASPIHRKRVITSRYGWRNRRAHKGIDIDLVTGDSVMTLFKGKVRYAKYHSGHGNTVIVRHYNGLETVYAHLSKLLVKENEIVSKGQVIALGGNTGRSSGSHLHLELSYKGTYIHPEYLLDFGKENKVRTKNTWVTQKWITPYAHNARRKSKIIVSHTHEEAILNEQKREQIYVVKRGDTLSKISSKYQVSIASLCKTNAIRKTGKLKIGQKILLVL